MSDLIERATEAASVAGMSNGAMILELRDALTDARATIERLTRERDEAERKVGGWTGRPCPTCKGSGGGGDEYDGPCKSCGGTGDEWKTWQARAEAAEAEVKAMREVARQARLVRHWPQGWTGEFHRPGEGPLIEMRAWADLDAAIARLDQPKGDSHDA